jgi:penicillin-binding protein 2
MNQTDSTPRGFETWRVITIYVLVAAVFAFFAFRLFSLQILRGAEYIARAEDNRTITIDTPTIRGMIYDRNNIVLAQNVPSYNITITPAYLPDDVGAVQQIYRQLSDMIGMPVNKGATDENTVKNFTPCVSDLGITQVVEIADSLAPYDPVNVKCNVSQQIAMTVQTKAQDWPGVGVDVEPVRDYPTGELTADVVGFLGPIPESQAQAYAAKGFVVNRDKVGYAGIEMQMNDLLMGLNGKREVEVDVAGQQMRDLSQPVAPTPGDSIQLTIDTRLQAAAQNALVYEMNAENTYFGNNNMTNGVVIAMNPKNGQILAMVSYPSYENNRMARVIPSYYYEQLANDPLQPLINHAISAEYPPGSVFKLSASLGILNEGVVTPDQKIDDPGRIALLEKFYPNDPGTPRYYQCWIYPTTGHGHGLVDFLTGLAQSCDVYFYKVGGGYQNEVPNGGLGIYRLGEYARALGYDKPTGIDLPGEAGGLIPDPDWKRINKGENWSTGDTYISTIGQGYVLSTPLQVLVSAATIANDGKMMQPTIVEDVLDSTGKVIKPFQPTLVKDITKDPVIRNYDANDQLTGETKAVAPWVVNLTKEGMRKVVVDGTAAATFQGVDFQSAGKTGTAEYCDDFAQQQNLCSPGNWPAHAWYVGYAPYDNPEIAVVAFVYHGGEGATVAAPIVRQVLETYFELKAIDAQNASGSTQP